MADERDATDAGEPASTIDALLSSFALKDETRTGWQLRGVAAPESVAAHSWGVSLLVWQFADAAGVDADRALRMAVVHDLAEATVGDLPTRADTTAAQYDPAAKEAAERDAVERFGAALGGDLVECWEAYEARESPEARFVKDMDLLDMCLQAVVYEREERYEPGESEAFREYEHLDEFFATAEPRVSTDLGRDLFERVRERYEAVRG